MDHPNAVTHRSLRKGEIKGSRVRPYVCLGGACWRMDCPKSVRYAVSTVQVILTSTKLHKLLQVVLAMKRREAMKPVVSNTWKWFDISTGKWCFYGAPQNKIIGKSVLFFMCFNRDVYLS